MDPEKKNHETRMSFAKAMDNKSEPEPTIKKKIGEIEITSSEGATQDELEEKFGNMDLTLAQKKAQIEAGERDEAKVTPEKKAHRQKMLKDFYNRMY